ncbi:MAG TPA: redox-regulated ATPase YchF [Nitrospiria bacterium]|jgi:GTP-binding protein YchF|nr:redox-regulated ATPase YchF [Nitrospiria bacterium]
MGFQCGIVGLPNVGKSTLFNALTAGRAEVANYPFTTIDPNVGIVEVPDERLQRLTAIYRPKKVTPTTVEFVDIAGLVKGASQGEGLGNKFLAQIREVDAIVHVVRCFENPDVSHVSGSVDPVRDIDVIHTELVLADLETIEKRLQGVEKRVKAGDPKTSVEMEFLRRLQSLLGRGEPIRGKDYTPEEQTHLHGYRLLTDKPILYVANVAEDELNRENRHVQELEKAAKRENAAAVVISGKVEQEIAALPIGERGVFLADLGIKESGLDRLIRAGYALLGLITFFTAGEEEVRAWTVPRGAKAPEAAGRIHSDMEQGFIRAEVFRYSDLISSGSSASVREKGLLRLEGKDYIVQDGDIVYFRFQPR